LGIGHGRRCARFLGPHGQDALWSDVLACDALPSIARRLDSAAADWCWKRIVVEDGAPLFDPGGAAAFGDRCLGRC